MMRQRNCITLIILAALLAWPAARAAAQNKPAFMQQETILTDSITADSQIAVLPITQKHTSRVYFDGLGRVIQSIAVQASPAGNDIIQPVVYDNLGRQTISYLPYAGQATDTMGSYRSNAFSAVRSFYNNSSQYLVAGDTSPYSQQVFENSPLQRLLQTGMTGAGFQPVAGQHYKTLSYRFNSSVDGNILVWNPDGTFIPGNYYAAGSLRVTDGKDEDGLEMLTFMNNVGQTVLKRQILSSGNLDTYYIYDMAGMLSYIVPPLATAKLAANSYNLKATPLSNLVFHYVYDRYGRLMQKTIPGSVTVSIIYDPLFRPVLLQDNNLAAKHEWNYIKYDAQGRVISQGIYTDNTHTTPSSMQTYVSGLGYSTWYESRSSTLTNGGYYTNVVFPTANISALAYSYYDNYDLNDDGTADFSYVHQGLAGEDSVTTAPLRGVPTITCQTTVGTGIAAGTWLTKVVFYDKRGNPIQTQSNNQMDYTNMSTLTDYSTVVPDFTGVPHITRVSKKTGASTTITVQTNFTYDPQYRLLAVDQYYNNSSTVSHVATYSYNELGQVVKKSLGYVNATTWLQNVDMRYNIRGQLLSINNSKLNSDGGITNGDSNDVFGMQLLYDQTDSNLGNTPLYDGRLSAVKWMARDGSGTKGNERAYMYHYDGVNRYTGEIYAERATTGTGAFTVTHGWDETNITYDQGGNILTLKRNTSAQNFGAVSAIDELKYTYSSSNPNQLVSVYDTTGNSKGFVAGSGSYTYDTNGNQTSDPYKGISQISYNTLNRAEKITFSSSANRYLTYTYDASGNLIRKQQYDNVGGVATLKNTTDYIDGFVYVNNVLSYFPMPEGRVLYNNGTLTQEFLLTDQQGNARVSFQNSSGTAKVYQETSFYGFGEQLGGSLVTSPATPNNKLYNGGSEWQNDYSNLPDYDATFYRNYDAALGRWTGEDPEAESAADMSVYQYAGDNPIMNNDPLGNRMSYIDGSGDAISPYNVPNQMMPTEQLTLQLLPGDGGLPTVSELDGEAGSSDYQTYLSDLSGDNGLIAQQAAIMARDAAGSVAGATPMGLTEQINNAIQPYAGNLTNSGTVSYSSGSGLTISYDSHNSGDFGMVYGHDVGDGKIDAMGAFVEGSRIEVPLAANQSAGVDWKGVGSAFIGMVGGAAEATLGALTAETGIGGFAIFDGGSRAILNGIKLAGYFTHNRTLSEGPSNFGGFVGKVLDDAPGTSKLTHGNGQVVLGALNDIGTLVTTGTNWQAPALNSAAAVGGVISDGYTIGSWYFNAVGQRH